MKLISFKLGRNNQEPKSWETHREVVYNFQHTGDKNTYDCDIKLEINDCFADKNEHIKGTIDIGEFKASTIDEVLNKLADWCERASIAIRERKESQIKLPI